MKKVVIYSIIIVSLIAFSFNSLISKDRIAVFPFINTEGTLELNIWSYNLQDSLTKAFVSANDGDYYDIVPVDSIEMVLAEMNLDPTNPQYKTDMWKAAERLNIKKVVTGNFNLQSGTYLINAYVYDVKIKLPHPRYQAKDIFKKEDTIYESIPIIVTNILPAFKK